MHWLSLGENCLSDNVLSRHGLKSFSTPFSHARTNIDHVRQADAEDFRSLLDPAHIEAAPLGGKAILRNMKYTCEAGLYEASVRQGFEFTHHDVLGNPKHRASYERKVQRWIDARKNNAEIVFLYHHRWTRAPQIALIRDKLSAFSHQFSREGARCLVILMEQQLVPEIKPTVRFESEDAGLVHAVFTTRRIWGGVDDDDVWARHDDALIGQMLERITVRSIMAA